MIRVPQSNGYPDVVVTREGDRIVLSCGAHLPGLSLSRREAEHLAAAFRGIPFSLVLQPGIHMHSRHFETDGGASCALAMYGQAAGNTGDWWVGPETHWPSRVVEGSRSLIEMAEALEESIHDRTP